jgi:hypothetical protein
VRTEEKPTLSEAAGRGQRLRMQLLLREANEHLANLINAFDGRPSFRVASLAVLCECGHAGCQERIELPCDEYEELRKLPTHFVLKRGHDELSDGRLVRQAQGHIVVEKSGAAGATAVRSDPRRAPAADSVPELV